MTIATKTLMTLATILASSAAARADQTWLCSLTSAVAIDEDGTVGAPDTGGRERPTFFRLDLAKKQLTLLAPQSRRGEVTTFDAVHESAGQWLFTGVEHGRGLSVIVTKEGRLSLSVVGDGVVWSVFGHALPEGAAADLATEPAADEPAPETDKAVAKEEATAEEEATTKEEAAEPIDDEPAAPATNSVSDATAASDEDR